LSVIFGGACVGDAFDENRMFSNWVWGDPGALELQTAIPSENRQKKKRGGLGGGSQLSDLADLEHPFLKGGRPRPVSVLTRGKGPKSKKGKKSVTMEGGALAETTNVFDSLQG